jgi:hypothetical protein
MMTEKENAIKEVNKLLDKINKALQSIDRFDGFEKTVIQSEVLFRYKTLEGFLLIIYNDVLAMQREWQTDLESERK